jgi:tRNA(Leu) C34 or U34 (ribose-2'-O)-methylase TrmL
MTILLYAPQNFNNLCVLARTLDVFGFAECFVYDPYKLIRERYGRRNARRITNISSGAFANIRFERVPDPAAFLAAYAGRKIATVAEQTAVPLAEVRFEASDLIVFGSEVNGIPPDILTVCSLRITIPQVGLTRSLNLAVAAGIVLYEVIRQMPGKGGVFEPPYPPRGNEE